MPVSTRKTGSNHIMLLTSEKLRLAFCVDSFLAIIDFAWCIFSSRPSILISSFEKSHLVLVSI